MKVVVAGSARQRPVSGGIEIEMTIVGGVLDEVEATEASAETVVQGVGVTIEPVMACVPFLYASWIVTAEIVVDASGTGPVSPE